MQRNVRGLILIGGTLAVIVLVIVVAGVISLSQTDDPELTGTFVPEDNPEDLPDCWYIAPAEVMIVYDEPVGGLEGTERVVPGGARYPALGRSANFLYIQLADDERVWVRAEEDNIEGECAGLPFNPQEDDTDAGNTG